MERNKKRQIQNGNHNMTNEKQERGIGNILNFGTHIGNKKKPGTERDKKGRGNKSKETSKLTKRKWNVKATRGTEKWKKRNEAVIQFSFLISCIFF